MKSRMGSNASSPAVIGIDIGKEVFHLVGFDVDGKIAFRRRIRRLALKDVFQKLPPCIVDMEACLSAHFVSRTLQNDILATSGSAAGGAAVAAAWVAAQPSVAGGRAQAPWPLPIDTADRPVVVFLQIPD